MVYTDPLTQQKREGEVILLDLIDDGLPFAEGRKFQTWVVSFMYDPDNQVVRRTILVDANNPTRLRPPGYQPTTLYQLLQDATAVQVVSDLGSLTYPELVEKFPTGDGGSSCLTIYSPNSGNTYTVTEDDFFDHAHWDDKNGYIVIKELKLRPLVPSMPGKKI